MPPKNLESGSETRLARFCVSHGRPSTPGAQSDLVSSRHNQLHNRHSDSRVRPHRTSICHPNPLKISNRGRRRASLDSTSPTGVQRQPQKNQVSSAHIDANNTGPECEPGTNHTLCSICHPTTSKTSNRGRRQPLLDSLSPTVAHRSSVNIVDVFQSSGRVSWSRSGGTDHK